MNSGTIKWFNRSKGFGFILPDDGGSDLFCHITNMRKDVAEAIDQGVAVTYDIGENPKNGRKHAESIRLKTP